MKTQKTNNPTPAKSKEVKHACAHSHTHRHTQTHTQHHIYQYQQKIERNQQLLVTDIYQYQ